MQESRERDRELGLAFDEVQATYRARHPNSARRHANAVRHMPGGHPMVDRLFQCALNDRVGVSVQPAGETLNGQGAHRRNGGVFPLGINGSISPEEASFSAGVSISRL